MATTYGQNTYGSGTYGGATGNTYVKTGSGILQLVGIGQRTLAPSNKTGTGIRGTFASGFKLLPATTQSPAAVTGADVLTDTDVVTSQGLYPITRVRLSFDDVSDSTPSWSEQDNALIREWSTSRGRGSNFDEIPTGTASVTFDNRERDFDPNSNASIRPLNRIWIYTEWNGEIHSRFKGYVDSWNQSWPGGGWSDAEAVADCVDEFAVLASMALPTTNPPRDSYQDLIMTDDPVGFWDMSDDPSARTRAASVETPSEQRPVGLRTAEEWPAGRADRRQLRSRQKRKRRIG